MMNAEVIRIDHGVQSIRDPKLIALLSMPHTNPNMVKAYGHGQRIPLTCCPRSNYKLKVFKDPRHNNLLRLLDLNVCVTVNSDDPAYFGGYVNDNYFHLIDLFNGDVNQKGKDKAKEEQVYRSVNVKDLFRLCRNGFEASVMDAERKREYMQRVADFFMVQNKYLFDTCTKGSSL